MKLTDFLNNEYRVRKESNPHYSQRSFAKQMGLSQGFCMALFKGNKKISYDRAIIVAEKLNFDSIRTKIFLNLVKSELTQNEKHKAEIHQEIVDLVTDSMTMQFIPEAQFRVISSWYSGAILTLIGLLDGQLELNMIVDTLGIDKDDTRKILNDMQTIGIIRFENGFYKKSAPIHAVKDIPSVYIQKFHTEMLKKAIHSIKNQDINTRIHNGLTLAFHEDDLPKVKQAFSEFAQKILRFSENKECNQIYHLGLQFFRLNQTNIK